MSHNDVIGVIHTASYGMSGTENLPAYHDISKTLENYFVLKIRYEIDRQNKFY